MQDIAHQLFLGGAGEPVNRTSIYVTLNGIPLKTTSLASRKSKGWGKVEKADDDFVRNLSPSCFRQGPTCHLQEPDCFHPTFFLWNSFSKAGSACKPALEQKFSLSLSLYLSLPLSLYFLDSKFALSMPCGDVASVY